MTKFVVITNNDYSIMINVDHISIVRQVFAEVSADTVMYCTTVHAKDGEERTFPMSLLEFEALLRGIPSPHGYIVSI